MVEADCTTMRETDALATGAELATGVAVNGGISELAGSCVANDDGLAVRDDWIRAGDEEDVASSADD